MVADKAPRWIVNVDRDAATTAAVLENGLRVVVEPLPCARVASIGVMVTASPRVETAGQAGLAHLTEHLMFQGTASRSATDIARFMDRAGGGIGAFTSHDYTCYSATVLDDNTPYALELLADVLLNSTFPESSVAREKAAVAREIDGANDSAPMVAHSLMRAAAWPGHSLSRSVMGTGQSVDALSREDVIYFVHQHYLPNRITIAASGSVAPGDFIAQVRDGFWRLTGESTVPASAAPTFVGGCSIAAGSGSLAYFAVGVPAPAYASANRYATHVLARVLGGGISSRLHRRLREERGLVYMVDADYQAYHDAGLLVVEGATAPGDLVEVIGLVLQELERLALGDAADADEIALAKTQIANQTRMGDDDVHTRMSRLAVQQVYFGHPVSSEDVVRGVAALEVDEVRRAAAGWVRGGAAGLALGVVTTEALTCTTRTALEAFAGAFREPVPEAVAMSAAPCW